MADAHSHGLSGPAAGWLRSLRKESGRAPVLRNTDRVKLPPVARRGLRAFVHYLADMDIKLPAVSRLILYGSYARGDFDPDSDVDVAVVLAGDAPEEDKIGEILRLGRAITEADDAVLHETLIEVNPMVLWESELSHPQDQARPYYYRSILKDGIEITAAL